MKNKTGMVAPAAALILLALSPSAEAQSLRSLFSSGASAQEPSADPRPPGEIPGVTPPAPAAPPAAAPSAPPLPPPGAPQAPPPAAAIPAAPPPPQQQQAAPSVIPPQLGGIQVAARFGRDGGPIGGGLQWRVYPDKPDATGQFRMLREDKGANPNFTLPPGGYIVHVAIGLASAAKRVQVQTNTVREVFELSVGGLQVQGKVGESKIASGVTFDLFKGSQFDGNSQRAIASDIAAGELLVLPEGEYYIVSNYGDGNAVLRADVRVQAGKLTEASVQHRAAAVTLKLVSEAGGEALANTAWSVLTPGGDVIKESIGAFPRVVLAEGDYVAIARAEGKVYNREFKVQAGSDQEIEMVAR
ncbi:hypothetical protein GJW-30_1_02705 [Variibacter gotjawalensis]|uniref:Uncharacterized protein n=1 Tax=Variibacter gotjawalensis TaxID=1333996 RepID=A0A0S3PW44_9BRAD|nr:hypothetical protein [Variibacter gotjawalensis]NIK45995.1 hypothetical protein [Variibacter gotjawalensis]RZS47913.1 hypothetical protein EV661_0308 [Variibacter gotjawalensis]BAT60169.1 hypothetical protein GJW-30_1_02705 [Variibacter gotjawalensis]